MSDEHRPVRAALGLMTDRPVATIPNGSAEQSNANGELLMTANVTSS